MTTILDPTDERVPIRRALTDRPEAIVVRRSSGAGLVKVGLL